MQPESTKGMGSEDEGQTNQEKREEMHSEITTKQAYDIGQLLAEKECLKGIPASERYSILTQHIKVENVQSFPKVYMNGCNRHFKPEWTKLYPWLVYSPHDDGGFCLPCVLFASKDNLGILVNTPFTRWTKVSYVLGSHEKNKYHMDALGAAENLKKPM